VGGGDHDIFSLQTETISDFTQHLLTPGVDRQRPDTAGRLTECRISASALSLRRIGPFELEPLPAENPPNNEDPPIPSHPNGPDGEVCYMGQCYPSWDTDGDGVDDWFYDATKNRWGRIKWRRVHQGPGDPEAVPLPQLECMVSSQFAQPAMPPDLTQTAEQLIALYDLDQPPYIPFSTNAAYSVYDGDIDPTAHTITGAIDVILYVTSDYAIPDPTAYGETFCTSIKSEIYEVQSQIEGNPHFRSVRVQGDVQWAAAYLMDLGVRSMTITHENVAHTITLDPNDRSISIDGASYGYVGSPW
jgi:hypothetical protein